MESKICGCKGIRSCSACEKYKEEQGVKVTTLRFSMNKTGPSSPKLHGVICYYCHSLFSKSQVVIDNHIWLCLTCQHKKTHNKPYFSLSCNEIRHWIQTEMNQVNDIEYSSNLFINELPTILPSDENIFGVTVVHNILTEDEESHIFQTIETHPWAESQSGRRKQDYGVNINFKKRKINTTKFNGLPSFTKDILFPKCHEKKNCFQNSLDNFIPVELCNLDYLPSNGAAIDPHLDDSWIWGERLLTFNILGSTYLTFHSPDLSIEIDVPLPQRSAVVVYGIARFIWLHSIKRQHIIERRIAITLRELSLTFLEGGEKELIGKDILTIASHFNGVPVNFISS